MYGIHQDNNYLLIQIQHLLAELSQKNITLCWLSSQAQQNIYTKVFTFYFTQQVYIVGHEAPGSDSRHPYDMSSDSNAKYLRTVRRHAKIIAGQFFGHLHADTFRVIYDNGESNYIAFMSPCRQDVMLSLLSIFNVI